jgi:LAGLIDADG endonuclease
MPGMVGGFGDIFIYFNFFNNMNLIVILKKLPFFKTKLNDTNIGEKFYSNNSAVFITDSKKESLLGSYLAGLIEGDGTFAVHNLNSKSKKYNPKIIIVFKKADLPLANYLQNLTGAGKVLNKASKGYILWQIQDVVSIFKIVNLINGYMRTPKIRVLNQMIEWLNNYIIVNQDSKLPSTKKILSLIKELSHLDIKWFNFPIIKKELDLSPINTNAWLAGFSDADANFSINICKRWNRTSTRVQLFYRLELAQVYKTMFNNENGSLFDIMSVIASYLEVNVLTRTRYINNKEYKSYIVMASSKIALNKVIGYFIVFPLLSSKHLDYTDWYKIYKEQNNISNTCSYLNQALKIREDFNKSRTTFNWDHLKNSYLEN